MIMTMTMVMRVLRVMMMANKMMVSLVITRILIMSPRLIWQISLTILDEMMIRTTLTCLQDYDEQ